MSSSSQASRATSVTGRIAIVVTGEPIERVRLRRGGFFSLIRDAWGGPVERCIELDARGVLPELSDFSVVIVSGSPASVIEKAPWMLELGLNLVRAIDAGVPFLGICFGHQLLAAALGGRVERNPRGREIGTVPLERLRDDPILDAAYEPFLVNMTHVDVVAELPQGAHVVARTELDPNAVVRFAESAWGVQFHPEIDAEVMRDYVEARSGVIQEEGLDPEGIRGAIRDTPGGHQVLARFFEQASLRAGH